MKRNLCALCAEDEAWPWLCFYDATMQVCDECLGGVLETLDKHRIEYYRRAGGIYEIDSRVEGIL